MANFTTNLSYFSQTTTISSILQSVVKSTTLVQLEKYYDLIVMTEIFAVSVDISLSYHPVFDKLKRNSSKAPKNIQN